MSVDKLTSPISAADAAVATDVVGLARLKAAARDRSPEALEAVARQFESLFMEMMLKSMRQASLGDGIFDSDAGQLYQGMFDKQISLDLSRGKGLGIADLLIRQLSPPVKADPKQPLDFAPKPGPAPIKLDSVDRMSPVLQAIGTAQAGGSARPPVPAPASAPASASTDMSPAAMLQRFFDMQGAFARRAPAAQASAPAAQQAQSTAALQPQSPAAPQPQVIAAPQTLAIAAQQTRADGADSQPRDWRPATPMEFVREILPHARQAAQALGLNPLGLVAQAALETGWGRHVITHEDGKSSFNLFGIKAGGAWQGEKATNHTLEFEGGLPVRRQAAFRSYGSIGESFADYVKLLSDSPRYREVLQAGADALGFAESLGRSGYATDPGYAGKIKGLLGGDTLRGALDALKNSGR